MQIEEALKIVGRRVAFHKGEYPGELDSNNKYFEAKGFIEGFNARGIKDAEIVNKKVCQCDSTDITSVVCAYDSVEDEILKLNVGEK